MRITFILTKEYVMFPVQDFDVDTSDMSTATIVKTIALTVFVFGYIWPTLMSWRIDHPCETLLQILRRQYDYMKSLRLW